MRRLGWTGRKIGPSGHDLPDLGVETLKYKALRAAARLARRPDWLDMAFNFLTE